MTKTIKILCDNCSKDLSTTTNYVDYRLNLHDEQIPFSGTVATTLMRYPSLKEGERHFCGIGGLKV